MGRFINADAFASTGQGIIGNNMFSYCNNNPVKYEDFSGLEPKALQNEYFTMMLLSAATTVLVAAPIVTPEVISTYKTPKQQNEERIYTVYFLKDAESLDNSIVYVGRVKTANFEPRMAYHRTKGREYEFSIENLTYSECRFIEQAGMIWCHTINPDNSLYNQIRGIGPRNPKIQQYIQAAVKLVGMGIVNEALFPLSYWANQTENILLNGVI